MTLELKAPEAQKGLPSHIRALPPERKVYLVIKNLRANLHPEAIYRVYLDLPAGSDPKTAQSYEVGTINFFNSVPHQGHSGAPETNTEKRFYSFDVTEIAKKVLQEKPTVTIAPLGEPVSEAKPVVGEISLVEQ